MRKGGREGMMEGEEVRREGGGRREGRREGGREEEEGRSKGAGREEGGRMVILSSSVSYSTIF